jgi:hypothetical protein
MFLIASRRLRPYGIFGERGIWARRPAVKEPLHLNWMYHSTHRNRLRENLGHSETGPLDSRGLYVKIKLIGRTVSSR